MHQFEIDLSPEDAAHFDAAFWDYLGAKGGKTGAEALSMLSFRNGERERRAVRFESAAGVRAFSRHWSACQA